MRWLEIISPALSKLVSEAKPLTPKQGVKRAKKLKVISDKINDERTKSAIKINAERRKVFEL